MLYLVLYDIADNGQRTKVAKLLKAAGYERIQYSVFVGVEAPQANKTLWNQLNALCDTEGGDRLFVITVSKTAFKNMAAIGDIDGDIDYLSGTRDTLFFDM